MKDIALGINQKNLKPYTIMTLSSSVTERKFLDQYFRIAEFNVMDVEDEIISYIVGNVKEKPKDEKTIKTKENNATEPEEEKAVKTDDDKAIKTKEKNETKIEDDDFSDEEIEMDKILCSFDKTDILLIDFNPNSNVLTLIDQIHKMYAKMIVILLIDSIKKDLIEKVLSSHADAYLVKPISKNIIYDKLKILLKRNDLNQRVVIGYKPKGVNFLEIHIPPLPNVLNKVILFDSEKMGGSEELEYIISPDKSLSADLMRVANSSFYGRAGSVHTLRDAITLMGLKTINTIVLLKFRQKYTVHLHDQMYKKYLDEFPVLIGLIAWDLTTPLNLKALNNEIFIHSILMKIGMTMLAMNQPKNYLHVLEQYDRGLGPLKYLEKEEFNTDYISIGSKVFKAWHLPKSMQDIVSDQEFTIDKFNKVGDLDRLLRVSEIFALLLIGRKLMREEIDIVKEILNFYNVKETVFELFNKEYYQHIKHHPFFELL